MDNYTPFKNAGSERQIMNHWIDMGAYSASHCWLEERTLTTLRPSLQTLVGKKNLVGVEVGVGRAINSKNILDHLDVEKLYLIDRNSPDGSIGNAVLRDSRVEFWHGQSESLMQNIPDGVDFVYLDATHDYPHVIDEIKTVLPKLKVGGLLAGHDYEQVGVCTAVNTFVMNLWRVLKRKPVFEFDSCLDNHPGYSQEYLDYGFPIDWWHVKDYATIENFEIFPLMNG